MRRLQEHSPLSEDLASVLGLLYTSPERFDSVSGEVRSWTDLGAFEEAQEAWRERESSLGAVISPLGGHGCRRKPSGLIAGSARFNITKLSQRELGRSWLDYGHDIDSDLPRPGIGALAIEEML